MFLGGLGIFLYGVQTTSDGLQKFAAHRLKNILHSLTDRPTMAVLFGIVMTVAFQSSAATNVLVVEFVNLGLMRLGQALGIVLGSALGTSVSIQLIAFKILNIALGAIFVGFILYFTRSGKGKYLGQALIGFGLIFVGMANMSSASAPLKEIPQVYEFMAQLGEQSLLAIVVGVILTTILQSGTAVFAIMISLADQGLLNLAAVVPLVLGVHIGGTVTPLISSLTADKMDAKRTAIANTGYKVVGMILLFPFLGEFSRLVQWTTTDMARQAANTHLLFSVFMLIVFLPFNHYIAKALTRLIPQRQKTAKEFKFSHIDEASLELPAVALNQVDQEVLHVAEFIRSEMILRIPEALQTPNTEVAELIIRKEKEVDWYYQNITRFINRLAQKGMTDEQTEESVNVQFIIKELEYIGDAIVPICHRAIRLQKEGLSIGEDEWQQLSYLYDKIADNYTNVVEALRTGDRHLAAKVIREHPEILRIQRSIQFNILGKTISFEGSSDELKPQEIAHYALVDLTTLLYSIDEHCVNIAQVIMGIL